MTKKVVLFLVDGMRPDGILKAPTPTMDRVMAQGAYTLTARTIMPSVTLPCHTSLFFSSLPERHGILTNTWVPMARPIQSLFDVLHQNGLKTASFYNWEQLRDLSSPDSLDMSFFLSNLLEPRGYGDLEIAEGAISCLTKKPFNFAFIYLGQTDEVGHHVGWMTEEYLESIHFADVAMGKVMAALPDDVTYLITADHGGHGRNHGSDADSDMTIPLLVQSSDAHFNPHANGSVSIMDIAPSILSLFGIEKPRDWDGKNLF